MTGFSRLNRASRNDARSMLILGVLTAAANAHATAFTWDGQFNELWGFRNGLLPPLSSTNWSPDLGQFAPIPDADDTVAFTQLNTNNTIDLGGSERAVQSVTFGAGIGYTLTNGSLTLGKGNLAATGSQTHRLDINTALSNNGEWNIANNGTVEVNATLSGAGATGLTKIRHGHAHPRRHGSEQRVQRRACDRRNIESRQTQWRGRGARAADY